MESVVLNYYIASVLTLRVPCMVRQNQLLCIAQWGW